MLLGESEQVQAGGLRLIVKASVVGGALVGKVDRKGRVMREMIGGGEQVF